MKHIDHKTAIEPVRRIGAYSRIVGSVALGENIVIGEYVSIIGPATISDGCNIGDYSIIGYPKREELNRLIKKGLSYIERADSGKVFLGENVLLRPGCTLYEGVEIGTNVEFGHDALVRENTVIGEDTIIGSKVVIDGNCQIGRQVLLHTAAYICPFSQIEDGVFIGPGVIFTNDKYANQVEIGLKGPTIKEKASIGAGAIILPGVIVGKGALIGAGAVVTKDADACTIYVGNAARKLKKVPFTIKRR